MAAKRHIADSSPKALRPAHTTPEGFLFCDADCTRTGIFTYLYPDGSLVRELRSKKEVADPKSLGSLGRKPLTNDHPDDDVTPNNAQTHVAGSVGDTVVFDEASGYVRVQLALYRGDAIQDAKDGKVQLSCGYMAEVVPGKGWWNPKTDATSETEQAGWEAYDARQEEIRYNHVALVNRGRAGNLARLRADVAVETTSEGTKMKVKIGDVEIEVADAVVPMVQAIGQKLDAQKAQIDTLSGENAALKAAAAQQIKVDQSVAQQTANMDWYRRRERLEKTAKALAIEKTDAMDNDQLGMAILKVAEPTHDFSKESVDYRRAYLDVMTKDVDAKVAELQGLARGQGKGNDNGQGNPIEVAQKAYSDSFGWKPPVTK